MRKERKNICLAGLLSAIVLLGNLTTGCQSKNKADQEAADSIARADSIAQADSIAKMDSLENEKKIASLIKRMFNEKLYQEESFLKKHCTRKLIKRMKDEGYESMELYWPVFTSEAQDGSGDKYGIVAVVPLGDNWFKYTFYEMGDLYSNKVKAIMDGADIKFDEVEHISGME